MPAVLPIPGLRERRPDVILEPGYLSNNTAHTTAFGPLSVNLKQRPLREHRLHRSAADELSLRVDSFRYNRLTAFAFIHDESGRSSSITSRLCASTSTF